MHPASSPDARISIGNSQCEGRIGGKEGQAVASKESIRLKNPSKSVLGVLGLDLTISSLATTKKISWICFKPKFRVAAAGQLLLEAQVDMLDQC